VRWRGTARRVESIENQMLVDQFGDTPGQLMG
jgi:hypothetical protein